MLHVQHVHHRDVCACVCPVPSRCVSLRTPVPPDSQAYGQTRTWTCSVSHKLRRLGWRLYVRHAKAVHGLTGAVHSTTGASDAQVTASANAMYSDTGANGLWLTTSGIRTNDTLFDVTKTIQSESATPLKVFANIHFQTTTRLCVISCSKNVNSARLDARHFAENNDSKRHNWAHQVRAKLAACSTPSRPNCLRARDQQWLNLKILGLIHLSKIFPTWSFSMTPFVLFFPLGMVTMILSFHAIGRSLCKRTPANKGCRSCAMGLPPAPITSAVIPSRQTPCSSPGALLLAALRIPPARFPACIPPAQHTWRLVP